MIIKIKIILSPAEVSISVQQKFTGFKTVPELDSRSLLRIYTNFSVLRTLDSLLWLCCFLTLHKFFTSLKGLIGLISASASNFFQFSVTFNFTQFNEIYATGIQAYGGMQYCQLCFQGQEENQNIEETNTQRLVEINIQK